ncbi:putative effector of murein hydrolase LrgA (UPF0299 family) [Bacteroides zoogleoformans]|nr:putative effector of murein hydrolase LrgA (UPF0299 family) [Bacteroides zoogleoformans]
MLVHIAAPRRRGTYSGCAIKKADRLQQAMCRMSTFATFFQHIIISRSPGDLVFMIRQCAILFGCLALGELVVFVTGVKLPSSIIGMLLLTLFLKLGWIKLHWVQGMSDFLVANLGFFFVPPGVALMLYFDIIAAEFWPIVVASLVSTLLVIVVTGWVHQLTRKIK